MNYADRALKAVDEANAVELGISFYWLALRAVVLALVGIIDAIEDLRIAVREK